MNFSKHCQFKGKVRHVSSLALALVSLLAAGEAKAASFNFTRIADTTNNPFANSTQYSSIDRGLGTEGDWSNWYNLGTDPNYQAGQGIAITNGGWVAYHAEKPISGQTVQGIYINNGGTSGPEPVITTQSNFFAGTVASFDPGIAVNANKETAFIARFNDGTTAIYVKSPDWALNEPRLIARSTDGYDFAPGVSINDNGEVAFTALDSNGYTNVYKVALPNSSDPPNVPTQITQCSATSGNGSECPVDFEAPSINNSGVVSFSSENGIFVGDGGAPTPIVSNNPAFLLGSYREPNINDNGLVSGFVGVNFGFESQIIFSGNGSSGSVIAGNNVPQMDNMFVHLGTSSINNGSSTSDGDVAFMAQAENWINWSSAKGIFTGSDPLNDKVIAVGDYLDVSNLNDFNNLNDFISIEDDPANFGNPFVREVVDLAMDRGSLSDENEIAFWARFANGTEGIYRANKFGTSQFNPWLPNCPHQEIGTMSFCGVTPGFWFDPPTAYGFHYEMDSDSLFTSILDLPSTFENPFTVMVEDIALGEFSSGDEINFSLYADLLGDLLVDGSGVKRFTVRTNDAIDPTNPMALPIKLAFNTEIADFTLSPVEGEKVPEPGMILGLLSVGAFLVTSRLQRK